MSVENKLAEVMAKLTCDLAKTCHAKETYFASSFNLTTAEFKCLRFFKNEKSISAKELGKLMELSPGRITHIITTLEAKKFVTRHSDPIDNRNVIISTTDKSVPFIKNVNESHINIHKEILEKIEPEKREMVVNALDEVLKALKGWAETTK